VDKGVKGNDVVRGPFPVYHAHPRAQGQTGPWGALTGREAKEEGSEGRASIMLRRAAKKKKTGRAEGG